MTMILSGNMKLPADNKSIFKTNQPPPYIPYTGGSGRSGVSGSYMRGYNKNGGTFLSNQGIGYIIGDSSFYNHTIDAITYVQSTSSIYLIMANSGGYAPNSGWINIVLSGSGGGTISLNRVDALYGTDATTGEAYWHWSNATNPFDTPYGGSWTLEIHTR